jgi:hypothetical protein
MTDAKRIRQNPSETKTHATAKLSLLQFVKIHGPDVTPQKSKLDKLSQNAAGKRFTYDLPLSWSV